MVSLMIPFSKLMISRRLSLFVIGLAIGSSAWAQVVFSPEKPLPGQPVSFTYTPKGTPLEKETAVTGYYMRYGTPAYMYSSRPKSLTLSREGDTFVGTTASHEG